VASSHGIHDLLRPGIDLFHHFGAECEICGRENLRQLRGSRGADDGRTPRSRAVCSRPWQPSLRDELAQALPPEQVSLIPVFTLAGGVLSGKFTTIGAQRKARGSRTIAMAGARQAAMVNRVHQRQRPLASTGRSKRSPKSGESVVTLATAWSKQHDFVASTIVAPREPRSCRRFSRPQISHSAPKLMKKIDAVTKEIMYPMGLRPPHG